MGCCDYNREVWLRGEVGVGLVHTLLGTAQCGNSRNRSTVVLVVHAPCTARVTDAPNWQFGVAVTKLL
jgi:hypothetical protein